MVSFCANFEFGCQGVLNRLTPEEWPLPLEAYITRTTIQSADALQCNTRCVNILVLAGCQWNHMLCFVFSYQCGDYVLNDNAAGDIQVLRSCLQSIATRGQLSSSEVSDGHKRLLRSCSVVALGKGYQ